MGTHNDCVDHDEPQDAVGAEVAPERLLYEAVPVCIRVGFLALPVAVPFSDGLSSPEQ